MHVAEHKIVEIRSRIAGETRARSNGKVREGRRYCVIGEAVVVKEENRH
jgi:hypothetical protein